MKKRKQVAVTTDGSTSSVDSTLQQQHGEGGGDNKVPATTVRRNKCDKFSSIHCSFGAIHFLNNLI